VGYHRFQTRCDKHRAAGNHRTSGAARKAALHRVSCDHESGIAGRRGTWRWGFEVAADDDRSLEKKPLVMARLRYSGANWKCGWQNRRARLCHRDFPVLHLGCRGSRGVIYRPNPFPTPFVTAFWMLITGLSEAAVELLSHCHGPAPGPRRNVWRITFKMMPPHRCRPAFFQRCVDFDFSFCPGNGRVDASGAENRGPALTARISVSPGVSFLPDRRVFTVAEPLRGVVANFCAKLGEGAAWQTPASGLREKSSFAS